RVVPGAFTGAAGVGGPYHLADEQGGRSVVEPLGHVGPDSDAGAPAVRARLLSVGQVDLDALAGQVGRQRAASVPSSPGGRGGWRRARRRWEGGSWGWGRVRRGVEK